MIPGGGRIAGAGARPARRLILSLDVDDPQTALGIVRECRGHLDIVKVGPALFLPGGAYIIQKIRDMGMEVFLDLKFHDIPNTVAHAARRSVDMGVWMFDVHTQGGREMMEAAGKVAAAHAEHTGLRRPRVIGITVLTSLNQESLRKDFASRRSIPGLVLSLASLARRSGLDGVVCSPREIHSIKKTCGRDFLVVVPGIRPSGGRDTGDQKRTATPGEAVRAGADYLVVGRPILEARSRPKVLDAITREILDAEAARR